MRAEAILCDLDGTIADTKPANVAAYAAAFETVGVDFPAESYCRHFGLNLQDMMRAIAPELDDRTVALIGREKQRTYRDYFHLVRPNGPLLILLGRLKETGHGMALATTARRDNVLPLLDALGTRDLFDVVVTAEDVRAGKPSPDAYLLAADQLGVDPRDCLVFEDSLPGIAAAEAAGCQVVKVAL